MFLALLLSFTAHAADDCSTAGRKVLLYSHGLRAFCSKDEDCKRFSMSRNGCRFVVLRKDAHVDDDKNLTKLMDDEAKACQGLWAMAGACAQPQGSPVCHEGKCEEGARAPEPVKAVPSPASP